MTYKNHTLPRKGFTLIELLTVIAIIGILAAIIIPTVGSVQRRAAQTKSSSNMRQIAMGYSNFSNAGSRTKTITDAAWTAGGRTASSVKEWAQVLANNVELTDASLWFIDSDEGFSNATTTIPRSIGTGTGSDFTVNTDWQALDEDAIGYVVVVNMSANAPTSTTPLLWTKGLDTAGEWQPASPWQGTGGHIAFMDGHVEWFDNLTDDENKLTPGSNSSAGDSTSNIQEAIRTTTTTAILPADGGVTGS
ncbi:type II secretion system protein [Ruficoccus amylovorans]|uniref:type II secretion system protein n=1 Tax=Ruficoccus amylovorans TaxID=1804625 RepID=UPI00248352BE|nr:prepilin-type N-terminal cleavage/methylation domain-containing protein [Ruficoccus amylovorans]